jgi:hypothetical protein
MSPAPKTLAVLGLPLAPQVVSLAQTWVARLNRSDIQIKHCTAAGQGAFQVLAYTSSPQGVSPGLLQQVYTQDLTPGGKAVIPVAREDAWLLAAFLKAQNIPCLTYGLGNAELVLTPERTGPKGLDITLKYSSLHSRFTLPVEDETQLVVMAAALALLVAGGIDLLDLLPLLTPTDA